MKRIIAILLVAVLMLTCLSGCGSKKNEKVVLKFNIQENEEHAQGVLISTFKEELEKISDGSIEVQLYFNGSLFNQDASTQAVCDGSLEMMTNSLQVSADYLPSLNMLTAPFIFQSYEHMRTVLDGEIGESIYNDMLESAPYVALGYFYNGARELNLRTDKPINTPADLEGIILRMPNSDAWLAAGESLGATATPLAYTEVYTALQNGTIDAQDNPLPAVRTAKFYEVTKQICLTDHIIDAELIVMNTEVWKSLSAEQQAWVRQAVDAAVAVADKVTLDAEAELVSFFENEGLLIVHPDKEAFREYSYNYYVSNGLTADWDMDLYNRIQELAD